MKKHTFDSHNVVSVVKNTRGERYQKIAVISITDIINVCGLVKYADSDNVFKVVWPYVKYYEKIGGRPAGALADV